MFNIFLIKKKEFIACWFQGCGGLLGAGERVGAVG